MMGISLIGEITVDFVSYDDNIVFTADFTELFKLLFCPDSADRVVRAAEDEKLYIVVCDFLFEIFKVNCIFSL